MNDLSGDTDFIAGMKFHSIVDRVWLQNLHETDIFSLCPPSKYIKYSIKYYIDWFLYDRNDKWEEVVECLDDTTDEEVAFVGSKYRNEVGEWHKVLQDYFAESPDGKSIRRFGSGLRASQSIVDEVIANYRIIKSEEKITPFVLKFYDTFEDNIS